MSTPRRVHCSIRPQAALWLALKHEAVDGGTAASRIIDVLIDDHLHQTTATRREVVERARLLDG